MQQYNTDILTNVFLSFLKELCLPKKKHHKKRTEIENTQFMKVQQKEDKSRRKMSWWTYNLFQIQETKSNIFSKKRPKNFNSYEYMLKKNQNKNPHVSK